MSARTSLRQRRASEQPEALHRTLPNGGNGRPAPQRTRELRLLNGFEFVCGGTTTSFPLSVQRLLALLALNERPLQRLYVAGKLWLDTTEERAFANLRSTLWRANRSGHRLVSAVGTQLALAADVLVDVHEGRRQATSLLDGTAAVDDVGVGGVALAGELLPDWYDDWVLIERERYRQLGLHALEALALRLGELGRYGQAADAALAAIAGEPLRESAHRTLISLHAAEGNVSEALRQYDFYRRLLRDVLGAEPSPRLETLVGELTRR